MAEKDGGKKMAEKKMAAKHVTTIPWEPYTTKR